MRHVLIVPALLAAMPAGAHALLEHADPAVGSTVPVAPPALQLDFSEAVEIAFSHVSVTDAAGARVDRDDLHAAPGDARRVVIDLAPLRPGSYRVRWQMISVDTHRTEGDFSFAVGR